MPHKMNSRSAERINGLLVLLRGYAGMAGELAGAQWNEGDVSDSVVRRVALPDAFFALDGLFETVLTVLDEFGAYPAVIARELDRYLPFLATTAVLMAAVRAGVGRETAHEVIKEHAVGVALAMREKGQADNDLVDRLQADERLGLAPGALDGLLADPLSFTGAASAQVAAVVARVVGDHGRASRRGRLHPRSDPVRLLHSGKVRDVYLDDSATGTTCVLVASDRISVFDVVLPTPIPDKGAVLTQLSLWWFDRLGRRRAEPRDLGDGRPAGVRRPGDALPAPGDAAGGVHRPRLPRRLGLKEYEKDGTVSGVALPPGLVEGSRAARAGLHAVDQGAGRASTTRPSRSPRSRTWSARRPPRGCAS